MDKIKHIKDTSLLRIGNHAFKCYTAEDGSRYLGKGVDGLFKTKTDIDPITLYDPSKLQEVLAYEVKPAINNLKTAPLKYLAEVGVEYLIDNNYVGFEKEPVLSTFDNVIKKVLKFNPNK